MSILKTRLQTPAAAATATAMTLTYTANTLTSSAALTIADGSVPTVAELGQGLENNTTSIAALLVDVADLRSKLDG